MDNSDKKEKRAERTPKKGGDDPVDEIENPGIWRRFLDEVEASVADAREVLLNIRELIARGDAIRLVFAPPNITK
jgi:hypothetical protein